MQKKTFHKIQPFFMIKKKNPQQIQNRGGLSQRVKQVFTKTPTANIKLNGKRLIAFVLRSGRRRRWPLTPALTFMVS